MKLTAEQLHERGPPLSQSQKQTFKKEAETLTAVGVFAMAATALDAYFLDHSMTRSEIITHTVGESAGAYIAFGVAAEYARAAQSATTSFNELRDRIFTNTKKFAGVCALALGVAASSATIETAHKESERLIQTGEAYSLPKKSCDTPLYDGSKTTARHFSHGREKFVFQHHLVDCSSPPPKGYRELPGPGTM